jgi:hypothetical protein
MPVYRYQFTGLDISVVKKQVPVADAPSVVAGDIASFVVWDITAPASSKDDLDDYLASVGWTFVEQDPTTTPQEAAALSPGQKWLEDTFTATAGQVSFILSQAPKDPVSVNLVVNGVDYEKPSDYVVSGTSLTWLNTLFTLEAGDRLLVRYK